MPSWIFGASRAVSRPCYGPSAHVLSDEDLSVGQGSKLEHDTGRVRILTRAAFRGLNLGESDT